MSLAEEIKRELETRQVLAPCWTAALRQMVRGGRWAEIGAMFDFEPRYTTVAGKIYFDWSCLPTAFWKAYQPRKYSPQPPNNLKWMPAPTMFRSKRLAAKVHPTQKQITFQRQEGICHYCRKPTLYENWSIDHRTPRCRGGSNSVNNKIGACKTCNGSKANLTEEEFRSTPPHLRKDLIRKHFGHETQRK